MDEIVEEGVGGCAFAGAVGPGPGEGAAGDGGPGDEAYACVLAVGDLERVLVGEEDGRG